MTPTSLLRRTFGVLRIALAVLILVSVATQIGDRIVNNIFDPATYFSTFTVQSNLMNVVVLAVGGWFALRHRLDTALLTAVRVAVFSYAVVTGIVYAALLRGIPSEGYLGPEWANEVLHVVVPIFIVVDWLIAPGRTALPWRRLLLVIGYPLGWLAYTLVRGVFTGDYPYPFLDPSGAGGWPGVGVYIGGIAAFILVIGSVGIATSRLARTRIADEAGLTAPVEAA
jgi:hypothetical protein